MRGPMLIAVSLLVAACQTTGGSPVSSTSGTTNENTYNWFNTPADHVVELLAEGRTDEAAEVYARERAYFDEKGVKQGSDASVALSKLKVAVRRETADLVDIQFSESALSTDAEWPRISNYRAVATLLIARERRLDTLGPEDDEALAQIEESLTAQSAVLTDLGPELLLAAVKRGAGADFFARYPIPVDRSQTLNLAYGLMIEKQETFNTLASFGGLFYDDLAAPDKAQFAAAIWSSSCKAGGTLDATRALCQLRQVADKGLLRMPEVAARSPVIINDVSDPDVALDWGTFAPVVSTSERPAKPEHVPVAVIFAATPLGLEFAKSEISNRIHASSFIAGTETVPNPSYESQKQLVHKLQTSYAAAQDQSTAAAYNTPACYDGSYACQGAALGAAIGSIGMSLSALMIQDDLNDAIRELETMPPTLTETIYADYDIDVTRVEFAKRTDLRILVFDRTRAEFETYAHEVRDTYTGDIHAGIHPDDPLYEEYAAPTEESGQFVETSLNVDGGRVIRMIANGDLVAAGRHKGGLENARALAEAKPKSRRQSADDADIPAYADDPKGTPLAQSPLLKSVVLVETPLGTGAGFYVSETEVLTNYHVIEGEKFADIITAEGTETFGKIIKTSVIKDLALIKVSARGTPAPLHNGPIQAGAEVFAAGHPKGFDFSLTRGIVSGMRQMPVGGDGAPDVQLVQTDAAINTGNSGGPLYLNGEVIGVNTQFFSKDEAEGISFAVHIDEVREFLAGKPAS